MFSARWLVSVDMLRTSNKLTVWVVTKDCYRWWWWSPFANSGLTCVKVFLTVPLLSTNFGAAIPKKLEWAKRCQLFRNTLLSYELEWSWPQSSQGSAGCTHLHRLYRITCRSKLCLLVQLALRFFICYFIMRSLHLLAVGVLVYMHQCFTKNGNMCMFFDIRADVSATGRRVGVVECFYRSWLFSWD